MTKIKMMNVEHEDLEEMITGMSTMCEGLWHEAFCYSAKGVLEQGEGSTEEERAVNWIRSYYDLVGGSIRVMAGVLNMLSTGITNDDLEITIKGE